MAVIAARVAYDFAAMLRLISYLAPSIPAEFFELAAKAISNEAGIKVDLQFEERISGPLPGDVNPFATGAVDVGFVCSPTFRWLADELDLLPVPVSSDSRARGRPVYFADVIVPRRVSLLDDARPSWESMGIQRSKLAQRLVQHGRSGCSFSTA